MRRHYRRYMTRAPESTNPYLRIIRLGFPILVGQLGMIIVGFADTKMVGLYSTEALASASFVNNLFNTAIFACVGFTYGLTPLVGSLFARHRDAEIGNMVRNGLLVNVLFSLLITAIMGAIYFNIEKLGQPDELLPLIKPYFLIYLSGVLMISIFNVFAQWAYAINRTRMPMWIILVSNVLNIVGNWLLIYGKCGFPELGLLGAGLSTLFARIFCPVVIMAVFFLSKDYRGYRNGFLSGSISKRAIGNINRTSWLVSLQMTFEAGSFTIAAVLAGWLGAISLAAFQVIVIIGTLGFCIYYSVGSAVAVFVANCAGLSDCAGMRRYAFVGYRIMLVLATMSSLFFVFGAPHIIGQFTNDPLVLSASMALLVPLVLYQYGDATQINFANALRGTSNVMPMLWIAFVSYMVIGVPATYLMAFILGLGTYGIILSFSVSLFIAASLFLYYFLRVTRK